MAILAGEIVTAGRLNRMQPTTYEAVASSDLGIGQTDQDVTGASVTLTTTAANAVYVAEATFDFDSIGTGSTTAAVGFLNVDGVNQTAQAVFQVGAGTANDRGTVTQQWRGTLASAGSHTLKLRGTTPGSSGNGIEINGTHTKVLVTIYEVV